MSSGTDQNAAGARSRLLPLHLQRAHADGLEAICLRQQTQIFSTQPVTRRESEDVRANAHVRGLTLRRAEAQREAAIRCRSTAFPEAFAGTTILAHLAPEEIVDPGTGAVRIEARNPAGVTAALARAGLARRSAIGDNLSVEARSFVSNIEEGVLFAHLTSATPRAGLIATSRQTVLTRWARAIAARLVHGSDQYTRALALLSLGRWAGREAAASAGFAAWADVSLGDAILLPSEAPSLIALALVGAHSTARRVARHVAKYGPTKDSVFALGLLGVPETSGPLLEALASDDAALKLAALKSLYLMTGQVLASNADGARGDGSDLVADVGAAKAFMNAWVHRDARERFHLGQRLAESAEDPSPSRKFLRALLTGDDRQLGAVLFPGTCTDRPRRGGTFFDILPPVLWEPLKRVPHEGIAQLRADLERLTASKPARTPED